MPAEFQNYLTVSTSNLYKEIFPDNILNDINLLYSYTEEDFAIYGVPVIENMIYNVCYTLVGTREFEPEFGSRVLTMIEEPETKYNMDKIELELFRSIKRWVPYANLIFRQTYCIGYPDDGLVLAYINYVDIFHSIPRAFELTLSASLIN